MFELNDAVGLWSLFVSAFISSTLFPGGSEVLLLFLATQTQQSHLAIWGVASLGNTLGGMSTFLLGWWIARRFPHKTLDAEKHQRALLRVRKYGNPTLLFSWVPVIGDPLCLVAGWLKMPWLWALLFIAVGKVARYGVLLALT